MADTILRQTRAPRLAWVIPIAAVLLALVGLGTWLVVRPSSAPAMCPGAEGSVSTDTSRDGAWRVECQIAPLALRPGEFAILVQWRSAAGWLWEVNTTGDGGTYLQYVAPDGSFNLYASAATTADGSAHTLRLEGWGAELVLYLDGAPAVRAPTVGDLRPAG